MASLPLAISSLTLLFLISFFPSSALSQNTNSSIPTVAQCAPQLLPLASCAPFVHGAAQLPTQSCCDNLNIVFNLQPNCLCLLLNGTALSSFPINATRALQLPALCTLPLDASACSALGAGNVPPSSPSSQVSFGANNNSTVTNSTATNSTVASSPMVLPAPPRPSMLGLGLGRSASSTMKLRTKTYLAVTFTVAGFLMPGVVV